MEIDPAIRAIAENKAQEAAQRLIRARETRRTPDLASNSVSIWETGTRPDSPALLAGALVHYPGLHAFWDWWGVSWATLADMPGVPPPKKVYPEAEYELVVFAINPELCPEPMPEDSKFAFLVPLEVQVQFHGVTPETVATIARAALESINRGELPPDSDFRRVWELWLYMRLVKHSGEMQPIYSPY